MAGWRGSCLAGVCKGVQSTGGKRFRVLEGPTKRGRAETAPRALCSSVLAVLRLTGRVEKALEKTS